MYQVRAELSCEANRARTGVNHAEGKENCVPPLAKLLAGDKGKPRIKDDMHTGVPETRDEKPLPGQEDTNTMTFTREARRHAKQRAAGSVEICGAMDE